MSNSVKQQLIQDLQMAGLAPSTQKTYLAIVVRLANRTRIRPQDATEAQVGAVAEYLRGLTVFYGFLSSLAHHAARSECDTAVWRSTALAQPRRSEAKG